jgi:hypothetical protein
MGFSRRHLLSHWNSSKIVEQENRKSEYSIMRCHLNLRAVTQLNPHYFSHKYIIVFRIMWFVMKGKQQQIPSSVHAVASSAVSTRTH